MTNEPGPVHHVVLFRLTERTTDEEKAYIREALAKLRSAIPYVRRIEIGEDLGLMPGNAHLAALAEFDSEEDYLKYAVHPAHVHFVETVLRPRLAERTAVQFRSDRC